MKKKLKMEFFAPRRRCPKKRRNTLHLGLQKGAWILCDAATVHSMPSLSRELINGAMIRCEAAIQGPCNPRSIVKPQAAVNFI
jgi:hypothetical protein